MHIKPESGAPQVIRSHQVATLPALLAALEDLVRTARSVGAKGPIDLPDFDPRDGVTVALLKDEREFLTIRFKRTK